MLKALTVENLLLIERAELELAPGLNVLTGETGAGKTLLATALGLLLGDRSRGGLVRVGAAEAFVEGVFDLPGELNAELSDLIPDGAEELVLARRVWPDGRSRAQICGRTATVTDLRALAATMLSFHGQHEHRRLTLASFQLELLDSVGGSEQLERRAQASVAHAGVIAAERHLEQLSQSGPGGAREVDLMRFEVVEIEGLAPTLDDYEGLKSERDVLRAVDQVRAAVAQLTEVVRPDDGSTGAYDALAASAKLFDAIGEAGATAEIGRRLASLLAELDDIAREARIELESINDAPQRLQFVEERLEEYSKLMRKHGGSVESVLAHADSCKARLLELDDLEGAIERAERTLDAAKEQRERVATALSTARLAAVGPLASKVEDALAELALAGASFSIDLSRRAETGVTGFDRVEFMIAPNPGIPATPLGDTASGGEMSRVLLGLLSVAHGGSDRGQRLLVFDEIDAGIGGRTAVAVGSRLAQLAEQGQILCITHLAPVAAKADRHFQLAKRVEGESVITAVGMLEGEEIVAEMVRMLGAAEDDAAARAHAEQLLAGARSSDAV
jgi:DNA repair protein RecN (Recombination protein N)